MFEELLRRIPDWRLAPGAEPKILRRHLHPGLRRGPHRVHAGGLTGGGRVPDHRRRDRRRLAHRRAGRTPPRCGVESVEILDRHELHQRPRPDRGTLRRPAAAARPAPRPRRSASCPRPTTGATPSSPPGMGPREARFYASLAAERSICACRRPTSPARTTTAACSCSSSRTWSSAGAQVSDGTWGIPPDGVAGALEDLAALHARFADPAVRQAGGAWVPVRGPGGDYGKTCCATASTTTATA